MLYRAGIQNTYAYETKLRDNKDATKPKEETGQMTANECGVVYDRIQSKSPRASSQTFNGVMLEVVPRLENSSMHLLHGIPQLDAKATENVALPCIILRIYASLHLLVVDDTSAERLLRLRGIEGGAGFLDLREQLLPVRE